MKWRECLGKDCLVRSEWPGIGICGWCYELGLVGSTVQYSAVQYSTVKYSAVQYSTVQYSIYSTVICGWCYGLVLVGSGSGTLGASVECC